ncbi:hypothetical protein MMC21_008237 [Puttea exsequens]|nr:hypothetical protein [Puttea exsequens]
MLDEKSLASRHSSGKEIDRPYRYCDPGMIERPVRRVGSKHSGNGHDHLSRGPTHNDLVPLNGSRHIDALPSRPRYERGADGGPVAVHREDQKSYTPEGIKGHLNNLYSNVKQASTFFADFMDGFQEDTARVEPYASSADQEWLWFNKIRFSNGIGPAAERHIAEGKSSAIASPRFKDVADQLKASLNVAIGATDSSHTEHDNAMARKLSHARKDISEHLLGASDHIRSIDPLLTELEILAVWLGRNGAVLTNIGGVGHGISTKQVSDKLEIHEQKHRSIDSGYGGSVREGSVDRSATP